MSKPIYRPTDPLERAMATPVYTDRLSGESVREASRIEWALGQADAVRDANGVERGLGQARPVNPQR